MLQKDKDAGLTATEEDLLPLSRLQHFAFCKRRWTLCHLPQQWQVNLFTAECKLLYEKAHSAKIESRPDGRQLEFPVNDN